MSYDMRKTGEFRVRLLPKTLERLRIPQVNSIARIQVDPEDCLHVEASFYGYLTLGFTHGMQLYQQSSRWGYDKIQMEDIKIMSPLEFTKYTTDMRVRIDHDEGDRLGLPFYHRLTVLRPTKESDTSLFVAEFGQYLTLEFDDCLAVKGHGVHSSGIHSSGLRGSLDLGKVELLALNS